MEYQDILYETRGSAVWITINRPDKYNAFRGVTCEELIHAITRAGWDKSVAAIVLTGAGEKAFAPEGTNPRMMADMTGAARSDFPLKNCRVRYATCRNR
jgi:enoyl-CoA hydratase/carnithine racemase